MPLPASPPRRQLLLALATLPLLGSAARAQDGGMGALAPNLLVGRQPPWTGSFDASGYLLENALSDGDVMYFYAPLPSGAAQELAVDLTIEPAPGAAYSAAGLLVNFDRATRDYLAVVLDASGQLVIYRRDAGGLGELARLPLSGAAAPGALRLALRGGPQGLAIEANGVHQGALQGVQLAGDAGIIAFDGGRFRFANYTAR